jgi:hypothetical protein
VAPVLTSNPAMQAVASGGAFTKPIEPTLAGTSVVASSSVVPHCPVQPPSWYSCCTSASESARL